MSWDKTNHCILTKVLFPQGDKTPVNLHVLKVVGGVIWNGRKGWVAHQIDTGRGPGRRACQTEEIPHTKTREVRKHSLYRGAKHWIITQRKKNWNILSGNDFTTMNLGSYDTLMYQKEELDKFLFSIKLKPLEKEYYLHGAQEEQKLLMLLFSLANPALQISESQGNLLWWCHFNLRWLYILNNHVPNTLWLSLRGLNKTGAWLSLRVLVSCLSSSLS